MTRDGAGRLTVDATSGLSYEPAVRGCIGREREKEAIARATDALAAGRGAAIAFLAAPGMGKTTLLEALAQAAHTRNLHSAWGVAWDGTGAPVFWPMLQALRALLPAARAHSDAVEAAIELLSTRFGGDEHDPAEARALSFERTALAIAQLGRPLVMLFDDLHAADAATLELLAFCLRATRGAPVLWGLAWRDRDDEARSEAVQRGLSRLLREVEAFTPRALSDDEIERLAEPELGRALNRAELRGLSERTRGNPLFLIEILRQGEIDAALPNSVRDALRARLERLDARSRRVLAAAATLGDELRLPALAGLLGLGVEPALAELEPAFAAELLNDEGGTRFRFSHPLVRETVLLALAPEERAAWHLRAAATLARLRLDGANVASSAIAHHMLAAGSIAPARQLALAAMDAAKEAIRLGADEDAADLLERALAVLEQHEGVRSLRLDLMIGSAEALQRAGRRDAGIERADAALSLARSAEDPGAMARAALARGLEIQPAVLDPALINALEEALARLADGPSALKARVLGRLAAARQPAPNPLEPIAMAKQAVAMADATADVPDRAYVYYHAGSALVEIAPPLERRVLDARGYEIARAAGERGFAIRISARLIVDALELGEMDDAERWTRQLEALVFEVNSSRWRWLRHAVTAMWLHARGDLVGAMQENETITRLGRELSDPVAIRSAHIQRMTLLRQLAPETLAQFQQQLPGEMRSLSGSVVNRFFAAAIQARLGEVEGARAAWSTIPAATFEQAPPLLSLLGAEVVGVLGDRERAAQLLASVEQLDRAYVCQGLIGFIMEGPLSRARGLLLTALGRADEAVPVLEGSLADCRARALAVAACACLLDLAIALRDAGRSAEARARLDELEAETQRIGAIGLNRAIAGARATLGPAPKPNVGTLDFSLVKEGELWRLSHGGRSHMLRDQRGFAMLVRLLERPGEEIQAIELEGGAELDGGDAGELLDQTAKKRYQARLKAIEGDLEEAEARNDPEAAEDLLEERARLLSELSRAFGLGGRQRRAGAAAERARVNVQRRLRLALGRIAAHEPALGAHLEASVITGFSCVYRPRPR